MTVKELIEALQNMPPDAEIVTEGCDCDGDVAQVLLNTRKTGKWLDPVRRIPETVNVCYLLRS